MVHLPPPPLDLLRITHIQEKMAKKKDPSIFKSTSTESVADPETFGVGEGQETRHISCHA